MVIRAERSVLSWALSLSLLLVPCLGAEAWAQPGAEKAIFVDAMATGELASHAGESLRADISVPLGSRAEVGDELHFTGSGGRFVNPWARYMVGCRICSARVHPFVSGRFEMEHHAIDALFGARIETGKPRWSIVAEEGVLLKDAAHTSARLLSFEVGLSYRIDR